VTSSRAAQREERALRRAADQAKAARLEEDPFAPLGIRAGGFILYPSIDVTGGYTTNATQSPGGKGSGLVTVAPKLLIQSDWSRHEATLTLRGSQTRYADETVLPDTSGAVEGTARIDISRDWQLKVNGAYILTHQTPSDTGFPAGADDKPAVHTIDGGAELKRAIGPAAVSLIGTAERVTYDPGHAGGVPIDQGDRDNTLYEARLRAGYAVSPLTTPFVEAGIGRRSYDRIADINGYRRSANTMMLRAGLTYESAPVLKGEIAAGWRREIRDDPLLPDLQGFIVDGTLTWSPTRLLNIDVAVSTSFSPTADPASAGSIVYDGTIDAAYLLRHNVTTHFLSAVSAERFDSGGVNYTYSIGAGLDWKLNRSLIVIGRYAHEWTDFHTGGNRVGDVITAGLRVQR
jgi:hypothetical protein